MQSRETVGSGETKVKSYHWQGDVNLRANVPDTGAGVSRKKSLFQTGNRPPHLIKQNPVITVLLPWFFV